MKLLRWSGELAVGGSKVRKVDSAGCEVHRYDGGLDFCGLPWLGVGEGKGRGSGEECWEKRGKNNEVTKAALFRSCGRGKTGISQG